MSPVVAIKPKIIQTLFTCLPLLLAASAILLVRVRLGFQFPVPWPDETGFVAPAFDMARTGSMFDPGLNPDRVVMWMPPGYTLVLAAVFRVFGYSFSLARWVSTLFCLGSLALAGVLAWRLTTGVKRTLMTWASGVVFISPVMLIDSNIARMEMLFCFVILLSLTALEGRRPYIALALVGLAGLVHFNAVYFVLPVMACCAVQVWRRNFPRPARGDWLVLLLAIVAISAYGIYAARNWTGFAGDMAFQFQLKAFIGHADPAHPIWPFLVGVLVAIPIIVRSHSLSTSAPVLFGLAFLLSVHEGHELWYDYGLPLGFLLILLGLMSAPLRRLDAVCAIGVASLVLIASMRVTSKLEPLLPRWDMFHRDVVAPSQIAKVRSFISTLHPGETVDFGWSGMEPFFFDDLYRTGARWSIIRHSVTQVFPFRASDWRIRCDSSEWPSYVLRFDIDFPRKGKDTGCDIIQNKTKSSG